jgi:hypothetical protein
MPNYNILDFISLQKKNWTLLIFLYTLYFGLYFLFKVKHWTLYFIIKNSGFSREFSSVGRTLLYICREVRVRTLVISLIHFKSGISSKYAIKKHWIFFLRKQT